MTTATKTKRMNQEGEVEIEMIGVEVIEIDQREEESHQEVQTEILLGDLETLIIVEAEDMTTTMIVMIHHSKTEAKLAITHLDPMVY